MMSAIQPTQNDPAVEQLYNIAQTWSQSSPSPATIVPFTVALMKAAQGIVLEKGRGPYKKQLVVTVLRLILERETDLTSSDRAALMLALETIVPPTIDVAVGIASGEIDLEKQANKCAKVWKACFPCCFAK